MLSQIHFVVTAGNYGFMLGLHRGHYMGLLYTLTTVPRHGTHLPTCTYRCPVYYNHVFNPYIGSSVYHVKV